MRGLATSSACGRATTAPEVDLDTAAYLAYGTPTTAVLTSAKSDVYLSHPPDGAGPHPFVVTLRTRHPEGVKLQAGNATPDWGLQWPKWRTTTTGGGIQLSQEMMRGLLVLVVSGDAGIHYSIDATWK